MASSLSDQSVMDASQTQRESLQRGRWKAPTLLMSVGTWCHSEAGGWVLCGGYQEQNRIYAVAFPFYLWQCNNLMKQSRRKKGVCVGGGGGVCARTCVCLVDSEFSLWQGRQVKAEALMYYSVPAF